MLHNRLRVLESGMEAPLHDKGVMARVPIIYVGLLPLDFDVLRPMTSVSAVISKSMKQHKTARSILLHSYMA